jgi:Family of unknown function (DUF5677)
MNPEDVTDQFFQIGRELAEEFLARLRSSRRVGNTEYQRAMRFFFSKAYKSFQAIELLWKNGFSEDAHTLARGIYELRLQVIYMSNDSKRSKQFFDHLVLSAFGTLPILRRLPDPIESILQEGEANIREGAKREGRSHLLEDPEAAERSIKRKWWGGGGIKTLLALLNTDLDNKCRPEARPYDFEKEYDVIYSQLSDHAHSGVRILHIFSVEESYRPTKSKVATLPWSVMDWLSQIIGYTSDAFELGFAETVNDAQSRAGDILSSVRPQS